MSESSDLDTTKPEASPPIPEATLPRGPRDEPPPPPIQEPASAHGYPSSQAHSSLDLGAQLYEWRHHTLAVFAVFVIVFAVPTARSATIGTLLVVAGTFLRLYSAAFLGSSTWSRSPIPSSEGLVRTGPYAIIRHPLYAANMLLIAGFAIYSGALWLTLVAIIGFGFQYFCIATYEDSVLLEHLDEEFAEYRRTVPAWIPARPVTGEDISWPTSWGPALEVEKRSLWAIAGLLLILILSG